MAPHAVNTTDRLHKLRDLMAQDGYSVDAIVIPSEDEREHGRDRRGTGLMPGRCE